MSSFIDESRIEIKAGDGGPGSVSFRREKYVPRGGPDGGNGGKGGDVIIIADLGFRTLLEYRYRREFKAQNGEHGGGHMCQGKDGRDCVIRVPVGTLIFDDDSGELIADLIADGQSIIAAKGGRGGKGNAHFSTSVFQTPKFAQPGEPGPLLNLRLELKLLADVGFVGFPNAGKSTLISTISSSKSKVADYPFTTLHPHLGVVRIDVDKSFVVADIPGLIEGSHLGKGLGDQFLRHIERSFVLIVLVDVSDFADPAPCEAADILYRELEMYRPGMSSRVRAIVASKMDLVSDETALHSLKEFAVERQVAFLTISAVTQAGTRELCNFLQQVLSQEPKE